MDEKIDYIHNIPVETHWFSGQRIIYISAQQIIQVRKGYWTMR